MSQEIKAFKFSKNVSTKPVSSIINDFFKINIFAAAAGSHRGARFFARSPLPALPGSPGRIQTGFWRVLIPLRRIHDEIIASHLSRRPPSHGKC